MPSTDVFPPPAFADKAQGEQDPGPLVWWVIGVVRKSLKGAAKSVMHCAREADLASDADRASLDTVSLRQAQQGLRQGGGALEIVDLSAPALMVHAMEVMVLRMEQDPPLCTLSAAQVLENAIFALLEYLQAVLAGRTVSAVALFPQYRAVQALAGNDKVHPADLWPPERCMREPAWQERAPALAYGPQARALLDAGVLGMVKSGDAAAAAQMRATCLGFVAAQTEPGPRIFWKIAAGFFDAWVQGLVKPDVYAKRVAARVLLQYAAMAKGDNTLAQRLTQDLLFFCAQARPPAQGQEAGSGGEASILHAVRQTFGLDRHPLVDYEQPRFGRFDPAVLAQARKRVAAATEVWSALAGGDATKIKPVVEQFGLLGESWNKLYPAAAAVARALVRVSESVARAGEPPATALAMEVATAVLYLQAALASPELADEAIAAHAGRLTQRLDAVHQGADSEPLEPWMEELYRHVSDSQTMGSVVDELRTTLAEAENQLDQFFRDPAQAQALGQVAGHLSQMRGVLSVLGLEPACQAMVRMREAVEQLMRKEIPVAQYPLVFERLCNNLGALGFLIDMLSYQRALARKLFVYDEARDELRLIMGRNRVRESDVPQDRVQHIAARAPQPLPAVVPREAGAPLQVVDEETDEELLGSFLAGKVEEIDFSAFESVMQASEHLPVDGPRDTQSIEAVPLPVAAVPLAPEVAFKPQPKPAPMDDNVKVIDGLRIPLPLYNVYLNEADEWSHRLDEVLQEWARHGHRPQPEEAQAFAHALAGASANVGFKGLSRLARTLEHALMHVRPQGCGDAQQLPVFQAAADEIRRLLHQFAAGFLKAPQPAVEAALQQVLDTKVDSGLYKGCAAEGLNAEGALGV